MLEIAIEDPRNSEVRALLQRHLDFCHSVTPPEGVFALDVEKLRRPGTTLFGARDQELLLGVCALKLIDQEHAELKSMHTASEARGRGVGAQLVSHVLEYARAGGLHRVSLETGSAPDFEPARALYAKFGFQECGPFSDYELLPSSFFMTLEL